MEKIGRGKYSDVYKCIDTRSDKLAVVKVLKPGIIEFTQFVNLKSKGRSKY